LLSSCSCCWNVEERRRLSFVALIFRGRWTSCVDIKRKMYETFDRGLGLMDTIRLTNYPQLKMVPICVVVLLWGMKFVNC
jgi:hypothetical protein